MQILKRKVVGTGAGACVFRAICRSSEELHLENAGLLK